MKKYKVFFFSSRRRHTRCSRDWSSDVCSSDLRTAHVARDPAHPQEPEDDDDDDADRDHGPAHDEADENERHACGEAGRPDGRTRKVRLGPVLVAGGLPPPPPPAGPPT